MKLLKALLGVATLGVAPAIANHHANKKQKKELEKIQGDANAFKQEAETQRKDFESKTAVERKRAQKLALRGLRSRRSASYFSFPSGGMEAGSKTVG